MSRSYKKNHIYKDDSMASGGKKFANTKVRNKIFDEEDSVTGQRGSYKKEYEQWDIRDFEFREDSDVIEKAKTEWENEPEDGYLHRHYGSLKRYLFKETQEMRRK